MPNIFSPGGGCAATRETQALVYVGVARKRAGIAICRLLPASFDDVSRQNNRPLHGQHRDGRQPRRRLYRHILTGPDYEEHAIRGFGLFLKDQNWANVMLDNVGGPAERCDALVRMIRRTGCLKSGKYPTSAKTISISQSAPSSPCRIAGRAYLETKLMGETAAKNAAALTAPGRKRSGLFHHHSHAGDDPRGSRRTLFGLWRVRWPLPPRANMSTPSFPPRAKC